MEFDFYRVVGIFTCLAAGIAAIFAVETAVFFGIEKIVSHFKNRLSKS